MGNEQSDTKIWKNKNKKKRVTDILSYNAELKNQMESIVIPRSDQMVNILNFLLEWRTAMSLSLIYHCHIQMKIRSITSLRHFSFSDIRLHIAHAIFPVPFFSHKNIQTTITYITYNFDCLHPPSTVHIRDLNIWTILDIRFL